METGLLGGKHRQHLSYEPAGPRSAIPFLGQSG